jgi:hypothetical protein
MKAVVLFVKDSHRAKLKTSPRLHLHPKFEPITCPFREREREFPETLQTVVVVISCERVTL